MKKINSTKLTYIILIFALLFNILVFAVGVLPPAGRAYYLPEFFAEITIWALSYFVLRLPVVCIVCLLLAVIQTIRKRLSPKALLVFGILYGAMLCFWYVVFQALMGI
ncbi:MAG: hypothetical protein IKL06_03520 [Lachnospiraceae bacterium]|nr:hypothetical protein [Lachnospiraceae bacterium]